MSEAEKAPETVNTFSEIVSTFSHQVPGVEIGFDVLTGFALIFTALGYLFSSSKDRRNTCAQELGKTSDELLGYIQRSETLFSKIELVDALNEHIVTFQNYIFFELTPSVSKWMSSRNAIEATKKTNTLTQNLALAQVEFIKLSNISIDEVSSKMGQSEEGIKEQEKKIEQQKEYKNKKEQKLREKLHNILDSMKTLLVVINGTDQALTHEIIDDKNSNTSKIILRINYWIISIFQQTKMILIFIVVSVAIFYIFIMYAYALKYIISVIVLASIAVFLWSKHLHNDQGKVCFESDGYLMCLKYGRISGKVTSKYMSEKKKSEADWVDGKQDGLEVLWHENGEKESEVNFKDGKLEGLATWWHENGEKESEYNFKDDMKDGLETQWHENGEKKSEFNYKDGKLEGLATWWHENGKKSSEFNLKDDMKDGLETQWHENGEKKAEANFKDGKQEGLVTWWHENGEKESEVNFKDGKQEGLATWWHENGEKKAEANFKDGKTEGLETQWHENGEKKAEANFKDGKTEGLTNWWHDDGSRYIEVNFKNGERHGTRTIWDKDGNVIFSATYENGKSSDQNGLEPQYDDQGILTHYIEYKEGVVVNERVENKE